MNWLADHITSVAVRILGHSAHAGLNRQVGRAALALLHLCWRLGAKS